jgi:P-type conjugative transfer protein TrbJ
MKTFFLALILFLPSIQPALAGGGGFAGATEATQIMNNVQLADSYAQQVMQYQNDLLRYQTMIKNLAENPMGAIVPQLKALASNHARVMAGSKDIGSSMARVDQDFAAQFQSETAASYADRFRGWTTHSNDSLKASMLNAGLQRENFANDEAALDALVTKNQASDGNLGALKTLGEINAQQLQESMKLRDLISQQQIAQGTYLASQNAKEQTKDDMNDAIGKSTATPSSTPSSRKFKY